MGTNACTVRIYASIKTPSLSLRLAKIVHKTSQPLLLHRALSLETIHPLTHIHTRVCMEGQTDITQQVSQIKTGTEALLFPRFPEWHLLHGVLSPPVSLISYSSIWQAGVTHTDTNTELCLPWMEFQ